MSQSSDGVSALLVDETADTADLVAACKRSDESLDLSVTDRLPEPNALEDVDCVLLAHDPPTNDALARLESVESPGEIPPVVVVDRSDDDGVTAPLLDAGASEYLRPGPDGVDPAELSNRIRTVVDAAKLSGYEAESNMLDALFEHIPVYLYVKDEEARHIRVSSEFDDHEEIVGQTDLETYPSPAAEEFYADDMRVIEDGEHVINREEYHHYEDTYHLASKVPWRDADGEIRGLIGVTREITDRKQYQQQLERQNERLRQVASVISHDVRNPLQVAAGQLELAQDACESDHLERADAALGRMDELLDDLLAIVQHGQWVEETDTVSVAVVATDCWQTVSDGNETLRVAEDLYVEASEPRLRQLLDNLLRNAVEHGPGNTASQGQQDAEDNAESDVTVTIGELPEEDGFYVADDGLGIPAEDRENVFEFGYTTDDEGGSGIGLAIVDVIADGHGWDVELTESESGGARFEFLHADLS